MKTTTLTLGLLAAVRAAYAAPLCNRTTSLREEAAKKDILIGSGAINPAYLDDPRFSAVLAEQFNSLSPENEGKWAFLNPTKGHYDWTKIDRLVAFAEDNNMVVKGHGLISGCCNPSYVDAITMPAELRAAMTAHFEAVMHRYDGKVDRWDVVTEALETQGTVLETNSTFYRLLGPSYIDEAFRIARAADPDAKLFFNENLVEVLPAKRQALLEIVTRLVSEGVPIDGVALQMHITEVAPEPGVLTEMVNSYKALGLEVTIAEMDVHTLNTTLQIEIYGAVITEALDAGITDISFWGFTDNHAYTWLPGAKPLMFNEDYKPKGAFFATHAALKNFVSKP
ncbi:Beta-xylanase [Fusarium keratoplasticum]|uniref:Beta-xylanase n=1 Tax=Fusarium keratoplasticum TaxID=1328300 RepID=A0ACC0QRB1_9HYPO|nr:Beta-xylanase [Fusarium keratoplasticum]KAI8663286.1 Beta-xylanase [Fusarium keratoplasticum]